MSEEASIAYVDEHEPAVTDQWSIGDLSAADWALSRICDLEREIAENNELAEEAIAKIKMRTDLLNERAQRGVAFFKGRLATFAQTHRELLLGGGKKKSRSLLHGSIGFRKTGGSLEVLDKSELLEWARFQPAEFGFVRIKEEPAVDEIKKRFKLTGEVPPGTHLAEEREEVVVKAEMGGDHGRQ